MAKLTAGRVRELLDYDPDTGLFRWRAHEGTRGKTGVRPVGALAGTRSKRGYINIKIDGIPRLAHRLAWLIVHGTETDCLDHADCDPTNNRLSNLRLATRRESVANRRRQKNNATGFKGVAFCKQTRKFKATASGKTLGRFETPQEAHAAYCRAAVETFGSFARFS